MTGVVVKYGALKPARGLRGQQAGVGKIRIRGVVAALADSVQLLRGGVVRVIHLGHERRPIYRDVQALPQGSVEGSRNFHTVERPAAVGFAGSVPEIGIGQGQYLCAFVVADLSRVSVALVVAEGYGWWSNFYIFCGTCQENKTDPYFYVTPSVDPRL